MKFLRAKRRAVVIVAFLFLICLIGVLIIHVVDKPVSGKIITSDAPSAPAVPPVKLINVSGAYASFSYPNSMHPMTTQSPTTNLATYNYLKTDILTWHLAIAINQLQVPSLGNDSGYLFRQNDPSEYKESTMNYGDNTFIVMTDTQANGFGDVAFILHGNMDATISLIGDDSLGTSELNTVFQQVLQSWQWQ